MKRTKKSKISSIIAEELLKLSGENLKQVQEIIAERTAQVAAPPAPIVAPPAPQLVNRVAFVVDVSSSMDNCIKEGMRQVRANFQNVKAQAAKTGQKTFVSFYTFGDRATTVFTNQPIERIADLPEVRAHGMTALCDAVGDAMMDGVGNADALDQNTSFLIVVVTDGGENHSTRYNRLSMASMISNLQQTDRWTFAFLVPHGKRHETRALGVPDGNIMEWENTSRGAETSLGVATMSAVSNYYGARSLGMKSTQKFYDTTNLANVTQADLNKLDNLSGRFKAITVDKESPIKAFAESHTNKPYVTGSLYYALTKREKVQAGKDVLIMEKGSRAVYGGQQARTLVGIKPGVETIVTPGNHANYDVYVKSTSVNRVLVRGTKVLLDLTKTTPDAETWDSTAAQEAADLRKKLLEAGIAHYTK